jgi:hypothetical protein
VHAADVVLPHELAEVVEEHALPPSFAHRVRAPAEGVQAGGHDVELLNEWKLIEYDPVSNAYKWGYRVSIAFSPTRTNSPPSQPTGTSTQPLTDLSRFGTPVGRVVAIEYSLLDLDGFHIVTLKHPETLVLESDGDFLLQHSGTITSKSAKRAALGKLLVR